MELAVGLVVLFLLSAMYFIKRKKISPNDSALRAANKLSGHSKNTKPVSFLNPKMRHKSNHEEG